MEGTSAPDPGRLGPLRGPESSAGPSKKAARAGASSESPAFRVLLERLTEHARQLEEASRSVEDPEHLAGAVDRARASLEDAQSLTDGLLEAFRADRQTRPEDPTPTDE